MVAEQEVPCARGEVQQQMGDHERPRPAPPEEEHPEQQPHQEVAREAAPPLVEVVPPRETAPPNTAAVGGPPDRWSRRHREPRANTPSSNAAPAAPTPTPR